MEERGAVERREEGSEAGAFDVLATAPCMGTGMETTTVADGGPPRGSFLVASGGALGTKLKLDGKGAPDGLGRKAVAADTGTGLTGTDSLLLEDTWQRWISGSGTTTARGLLGCFLAASGEYGRPFSLPEEL